MPPFKRRLSRPLVFLFALLLLRPAQAGAYSVLTHQALVDAAWTGSIVPALKARFPNATDAELKVAHAYAYGGVIAPDMGYFPLGSKLFTALSHHVRTGTFVQNLLSEARTLNELAFALGSLAHYHGDITGHPMATNRSVPIIYPDVARKFGDCVSYGDNHLSHTRTEFSFDVLQTARGNYASRNYRDFIGFEIDTSVLERAFFKTYDLHLGDLFKNLDRSVRTFRWMIAHFIPAVTRTAWATKRSEIQKLQPDATARSFRYRMTRINRNRQAYQEDEKPALGTTLVSFFIRVMPKVGPFRILSFRTPGRDAEDFFVNSFDSTLARYRRSVAALPQGLQLADLDYDLGCAATELQYVEANRAFAEWLLEHQRQDFRALTPASRSLLLEYWQGRRLQSRRSERKVQGALAAMRTTNAAVARVDLTAAISRPE